MGSFKSILEKYHLEKWFQRDNLIVLVLAGILLVIIALPTKEAPVEEERMDEVKETVRQVENPTVEPDYYNPYEYTAYLEEKLTETLTQMKGVGQVSVMITLEASAKQIVEKEENLSRNNTAENDSEGGKRSIYEIDSKQQTVYSKEDNAQYPYVSQTVLPEISGVLIVAQGAEVINIKKSIIEIAQALFDIDAHKISVVSMKEK